MHSATEVVQTVKHLPHLHLHYCEMFIVHFSLKLMLIIATNVTTQLFGQFIFHYFMFHKHSHQDLYSLVLFDVFDSL